MDKAAVDHWLKAYMKAWETNSPAAIGELFSDDATYSYHPYDEPVVGRQAIVDSWLKDQDAPGTFTANYEPIAIDGDVAVVNGRSTYFKDSSRRELTKEWDNLFVIQFDKDGRCRSFREWYVPRRGQSD
ncbi:MAG: nuclear transport factor 2 family protein [Candidatus Dormibacteraeota bacterium]|nr:nuclear transport factor 2 family protein [Candidatus Dormibacteraeota bacterium]